MGQGRGKVIRLYDRVQPTDLDDRLFFDPKYVYHPPDGRELSVADIPVKLRQNLIAMDAMTNKHKKEILGIFDREGNLLLSDYVIGSKNGVTHPKESIRLLEKSPPGSLVMVHTHPSSNPFSDSDHQIRDRFNSIGADVVLARGNVLYSIDTAGQTSKGNRFLLPLTTGGASAGELERRLHAEFQEGHRVVAARWKQGAYDNRKNETFVENGIRVSIGRTGNLKTGMLSSNWTQVVKERCERYTASQGLTMRTERLTPLSQSANIQNTSATPRTTDTQSVPAPARTTAPRSTTPATPSPIRPTATPTTRTPTTPSTTPTQNTPSGLKVGDTITVRVGRKNQTVNITESALRQGYTYKTVNGVKYRVDILNRTSTRM